MSGTPEPRPRMARRHPDPHRRRRLVGWLVETVLTALVLLVALGVGGVPGADAAIGDELLPNPGLEQASGTQPLSWIGSSWGTNTHTFSYVSGDAHSGTRSVKVDVSAYTDGDNKWMPSALVPVSPGQYYVFSDWYKASATTAVSVYYETAIDPPDGGRWANLFAGIPATSTWTQYTTGFTMPAAAVRAVFVHFIAGKGFLQTDDYSLKQVAAPPGFGRPMISLTFDDGSANDYRYAIPALNARGFESTQYIPTAGLTSNPPDPFMMTAAQIREIARSGHEIGAHSVTHPDLTTVSDTQLATELNGSKATLESILGEPGSVTDFAYPYGAYDARVISALKTAGYRSGRSVEEGYTSALDIEPYGLRGQNMLSTTTLSEFQSWIDYARANNYWLVVIYHEIVPDSAPVCTDPATVDPCLGPYDTTVTRFAQQLDYIASQGLGPDVMTVQRALDAVQGTTPPPPPPAVATPAMTDGPSGTVSSASAAFTFTAAPGTLAQCALDGAAFADCTSPETYTGLADGSHTFILRARDNATPPNVSSTVSRTWTVATAAPTVTITSKPPALTNSRTATFAFTGPAQTTFECRLDGAAFAACTSPRTYSSLANGSHTVQVRGRGPSGILSPVVAYTWTIDTVAPSVSITSGPASTTTSTTAFAFSANDPQATFQCRIDGAAYATCVSPKTYANVAPGRHTFQVRAIDPAGNTSSAASRTWRIR